MALLQLFESKNSNRLALRLFCIAAPILLLAGTASSYLAANHLRESGRWVAHSSEVLLSLEDVASLTKDAETGQRGYFITGNSDVREPYDSAIQSIESALTNLQELTLDNTRQQSNFLALKNRVKTRFNLLNEAILVFQESGYDAVRSFILSDMGRLAMDAVRSQIAVMEAEEKLLLAEREDSSQRAFIIVLLSGVLICILGILLLALIARLMAKMLAAESEASQEKTWLSTTLACIGDAVIATDSEARIRFMNKSAASITGWTEDEAKGLPLETVFKILNEETRQTVENPAVRALDKGRIMGLAKHTSLISKTGKDCPIDDSAAPIRNEKGDIIGSVLVFRDITESKHAEDELRESQQFIRSVLHNLFAFVGVMTVDGTLTDANLSSLEAAGIPASEVLGKKFWDCYWWSYSPEIQSQLRDACVRAAGGEVVRYDVPVRMADDTRAWIDFQISPLRDAEGRVTHLIPTALEIEVRRAAEEKMRLSDQRMRMATAATSVGIWEWNLITGKILWDATMFQIYGIDPSPDGFVNYHDWSDSVVPEDLREQEEVLDDTAKRQGSSKREFRIKRRNDGECRHIAAVETVRANKAGQTEWVVGTNLDITVRKQAEAALLEAYKESADLKAALNEHAIVAVTDSQGKITFVNDKFCAISKYSREELIGQDHRIINSGHHPKAFFRDLWSTIAQGRPWQGEIKNKAKDGSYYWVDTTIVPFLSVDGKPLQYVAIRADITERKQGEFELLEAGRRKDEFLATLAHELRNPLAPIRTGLQLMKLDRLAGPSAATREIMERQVNHMVRLVDDLLDISRVSQGKIILKKEKITIQSIIDAALETSRPLIDEGKHEFHLNVPKEILYLDADLIRISQAISNILNNAAKYTPEGGQIALSVEKLELNLLIKIIDNGIGVPKEMIPKLFDIFTQVGRSIDRSQGGLGVGLSLVKKLVELHEGTVDVDSPGEGRGSTFTIILPLGNHTDSEVVDALKENNSAQISNPKRILVVDDNHDGAAMLAALLEMSGHEIVTVHSGLEALEAAKEFHPEIVFLDIGLPDMNGYEVAVQLRNRSGTNRLILVALTGWGGEADKILAFEAGFDFHQTKPIDFDALENILASLQPPENSLNAGNS